MDKKTGTKIQPVHPGKLGNTNAQKHSLYATRTGYQRRARRVRKLVQRMYTLLPWLEESDRATARAWADLEYKVAAVSVYLEQQGIVNNKGEPRRILNDYRGLLSLQLQFAKELGLTPASRAALRVDALRGDDLAKDLAQARNEIRES